jgi:uncharacterized protein (TIGR02271 family)
MDPDGHLSEREEQERWRHDGLHEATTIGRDAAGPAGDDAMTRSEEELVVGAQPRERGRARRRKHVTTQTQQVRVPVRREEVRVEREPIGDASLAAAGGGPALAGEEQEVTLGEEEVVVGKRAVPRERVRLGTEAVTDQRQVAEEASPPSRSGRRGRRGPRGCLPDRSAPIKVSMGTVIARAGGAAYLDATERWQPGSTTRTDPGLVS